MAALKLRVWCRNTETRITERVAWDMIAEVQTILEQCNEHVPTMKASDVIRIAVKEFKANLEYQYLPVQ